VRKSEKGMKEEKINEEEKRWTKREDRKRLNKTRRKRRRKIR
jgi:hypothetical protein